MVPGKGGGTNSLSLASGLAWNRPEMAEAGGRISPGARAPGIPAWATPTAWPRADRSTFLCLRFPIRAMRIMRETISEGR